MAEPININVKLEVSKNPIGIPPGTMLDVKISIIDEFEIIWTSNASFTKEYVRVEKLKHPERIAKYSERNQRAVIKYPMLTQKEIAQIVSEDLKKLGVKHE